MKLPGDREINTLRKIKGSFNGVFLVGFSNSFVFLTINSHSKGQAKSNI